MRSTKSWAVLLIFVTTGLTSSAQILYKYGAGYDFLSFPFIGFVAAGLSLYVLGFLMMMLAFRHGEVTVLFPIFASSYIWVALMSLYFFGEQLSNVKVMGIFIIVMGIALISFGSKQGSVIQYEEVP